LTKAVGGINATWTQNYVYDRYGNRTGVSATGAQASLIENNGDKKDKTEGSNANASDPETVNRKPFDFAGDNKADPAVWQQSNGSRTIKQSSDNQIDAEQNNFTEIGQSRMIFRQCFIKFVKVKGENFPDQESSSFV
jgi:hypothetical protein